MNENYVELEILADSINPDKVFRMSFEKEIKDGAIKNTLNEYFDCLENISKGLTYICVMDSLDKLNIFGKLLLKLRKITEQDKNSLKKNLVLYNCLRKDIDEYLTDNINSLNLSFKNFHNMNSNIDETKGILL